MNQPGSLEARISRWARLISLIGLAGLLFLAAITVAEVLSRWLLNYPVVGVSDVSSLAVSVAVASCFPLTSADKRHITVRLAGNFLGPRAHAFFEAFGALLTMTIMALMAWQLWRYASEMATAGQTTWVVLWPVAPWWRIVTILVALCVPMHLVSLFTSLRTAFSPGPPPEPANGGGIS